MTDVLLVRHAQPQNPRDEASALSDEGRAESRRLARALDGVAIDAIYSSPAPRALATIQPLAELRGLSIAREPELHERDLGTDRFPDLTAAIRATWDDFGFAHPGGESNAAAQRRIVAALERLAAAHADGHLVVATHGNVLALLLRHYDPRVGFAFWASLRRPDVYRLRWASSTIASFERMWRD